VGRDVHLALRHPALVCPVEHHESALASEHERSF